MNKTKKDKYLRKNRHGKNSKHKNKTRKVQRGGKVAPVTNKSDVVGSEPGFLKIQPPPLLPPRPAELNNAIEERKTRAPPPPPEKVAAPEKVAPPEKVEETARPEKQKQGNFKSTNMGFGFGGPIQPSAEPEAAATLSSSPAPPAAANKTPTAPAKAETNEERDAQLAEVALEISKGKQKSNPQAVALANSPSNIMKSFFLNLFESKKKELPTALAIDNLTKNISTIIDENDKNLDIVNKVGDAIRKHIHDIIDNNKNLSDLTDDDRRILIVLIGDLARVGEIAQKIANSSSELAYAGTTGGNLDALKQSRYNQGLGGPRNAGVAKTPTNKVPTPSSGKKQDSPSESAKPKSGLQKFTDFFTKKNKKQEPAAPTEPPATPAAATPVAATTAEATPAPISQGGGNKTRKNRQYIREIKDNRTHLFKKEMEIINSIRNFKHGRIDNDNTKKQFMKAVKRG